MFLFADYICHNGKEYQGEYKSVDRVFPYIQAEDFEICPVETVDFGKDIALVFGKETAVYLVGAFGYGLGFAVVELHKALLQYFVVYFSILIFHSGSPPFQGFQ